MTAIRGGAALLLIALLSMCSPGPARAESEKHSEPDKDHAHPKADKGDAAHPPADKAADAKHDAHGDAKHEPHTPFTFAAEEAIWTLAVFFLLLIVLRKYAWKPILEGLYKREEHIRLAVDEAKIARQETEKARLDFKAQMDKAYAEIPKIMEEARREAAAMRDEMRSRAVAEIQSDRDRLRREIETARDQALQELWTQTATLATLISAKAIGRSLSADDHRRLTEEALTQVEGASAEAKHELQQFAEEYKRKGGGRG